MNTFRIKRRVSGAPGAPATLLNAELAYNEVDNILYYGQGVSTGVTSAAVIAIAGTGITVQLAGDQSIGGIKTFTSSPIIPTPLAADNSTKAAPTAWVRTYAQPLATGLTALAALATFGLVTQTSAGVYTTYALAGTAGRITVSNGNGIGGAPTFDLATVTDGGTGTLKRFTVDTFGRVTGTSAVVAGDITTALGFTPENVASKGLANGYASLDGTGKVPVAQLPASVAGGMNYQGVWNASTNTPLLTSATGVKGYFYKVSVAGNTTLDGNSNWTVGDVIAFNGTVWDKMEGGQPDVVSVAGRIGAITLAFADISGLGNMATQASTGVSITGGTIAASTISGNIAGNAANVTGVVAAANGGTGAATLTGYVKGNGASIMTAAATIPNTDISGLGTMSTQSAANVNITGGLIDGITFDCGTF